MKTIAKAVFGVLLVLIIALTMLPTTLFVSAAEAFVPGDVISFGSYPQSQVTDSALITRLNSQAPQGDNTVIYYGSRYKRIYITQYTPFWTGLESDASNSDQDDNGYYINTVYWFKVEPIEWRVLSNSKRELFLLAEKILISQAYNGVTWETCTLRSWLNGEFYNEAFSNSDKAQIITSKVVNDDNPWYHTKGGNDTSDKVFLLSFNEVMNPDYGFSPSESANNPARQAQGSDYAKSFGLRVNKNSTYSGNGNWWLRSPGRSQGSAGTVDSSGYLESDSYFYGDRVNDSLTNYGARPAIKLKLPTTDSTTTAIDSTTVNNDTDDAKTGGTIARSIIIAVVLVGAIVTTAIIVIKKKRNVDK